MDPDRWHRVTQIFHGALEREGGAREIFLGDACAGDPTLQADVERMLAGDSEAGRRGDPFTTPQPRIDAGAALGPYRVEALLGAGGMGEVYKARDTRLNRTVAIKVLPAALRHNPGLSQRFEREAQAVAALNHPNICTVHDVGQHEGIDFLVMEYLDGETLERRLQAGALALEQALTIAMQVTNALDKAHRAGIVHRDLKPGNVMLTKSGVKVLDFGLAKFMAPALGAVSALPTAPAPLTDRGMIVGTLQYMAPEQLEGREADARTDVFALGTLIYEMVTGRRAFEGANATSLVAAILRDEPPAMSSLQRVSPAALDVVVHACLAKDPDARIQTIYDVGLQLRWIRDGAFSGTPVVAAPVPRRGGLWRALAVAVIAAAVGGLAVAAIAQRNRPDASEPSFRQLTFRRGFIDSARFTPDGQTILYSAVWDGKPRQIFSLRVDSGESQPLPLPPGLVLSISRRGELALLIKTSGRSLVGTLASVPLGGGGLREVLDNVSAAEWSPDGKELAVLRRVGTETLLEYPIGTELRRWTDGDPCCFRISPDGTLLAVLEQNPVGSGRGFLSLIDRTGRSVKTSRAFGAVTGGVTWTPSGDEAWFNASEVGLNYSVYALSRTGQERLVRSNAESLQVSDRAADGRAIVTSDRIRGGIVGLAPGETQPRDLSWMDFGRPTAVSRDGRLLAFTESGAGVGPIATAFVRGTDGSPAIRIAEGAAMGLSPDGRSILLITRDRRQIKILPIGAGSPRVLEIGNLQVVSGFATWTPDGMRVIFSASEPGRPRRLFSSSVNGGGPVPVTPEQIRSGEGPPVVSPDSRWLVALDAAAKVWRYSLDGGAPAALSGFLPGDQPLQWSPDGRAIWVLARERPPARIERVDLATGARSPWREIADADPSGLDHSWFRLLLSADGTSYVYGYARTLSDLFLAEGLK